MTSRYIAIDWGSTNLRAWLCQNGTATQSRHSQQGITRLNGQTPQAVLAELTHGWCDSDTPIIMAGMVGSNVGWKEAPYLPLPVTLNGIGERLTHVTGQVWIVPGLSVNRSDNHNVIRGEETQLLGAYQLAPSSLYVLPGTHSKWVQADSECINDFRTQMTGELHDVLLRHTLVGAGLPPQVIAPQAFSEGLTHGLNDPAVLPMLFEVRAAYVLGALPREQVSEFLSGVLIGAEVAAMATLYSGQQAMTLVAGANLAARYRQALDAIGRNVTVVEGDTAFQAGIRSIAYAVAI
ncbi:2-dehydro-3-deoxygalactonokinase [Erwinia sp. INIA-01]|uniref:2-dehydro-3-deoxygalactonokinase n=1 Tax=Erwinia sp. INIA01 TaxID=2991500 RepID=UPI0022243711|nr:2-dehydro-3-deoxygalactonokinase [Erwinia sp. INIA01]MCW1876855.1 2-dehydro-3-deoxygalactonokinase [Erwinia sp. INIA01]